MDNIALMEQLTLMVIDVNDDKIDVLMSESRNKSEKDIISDPHRAFVVMNLLVDVINDLRQEEKDESKKMLTEEDFDHEIHDLRCPACQCKFFNRVNKNVLQCRICNVKFHVETKI